MSRIHARKGFSLNEAIIAIGVVGCLVACAIGMFNYFNLKDNTLSAKQAKVESALKSATMSIIGKDTQLSVKTACDPIAMRNLYAARLVNAKVIDNVKVNGKSLPALKIDGYGIMAFEPANTCEASWHGASTLTKTSSSSQKGTSGSSDKTDSTAATTESPVVVYSVLDDTAEKIEVPSDVTANGSNSSDNETTLTSSAPLTMNTMAFAVSANGIKNTYSSVSTAPATTTLAAAPSVVTTSVNDNTVNICAQGDDYSYVSTTCPGNISVQFYEMMNETSCRVSYCPGNGIDNSGNLVTSGQINMLCKAGNGNVGQCSCPAGKDFYVPRYVVDNSTISGICITSCAEFNMIDIGGNQCDCAQGAVWNAEAKKCVVPGVCTEDYLKWDDATASCVCKTQAELLEMDRHYFALCEVYDSTKITDGCKRLRENWDMSTGTCVCPVPFTQVGTACTCQAPRVINQAGECVCDFDKVEATLANDEIFVQDDYNPTCKIKCDTANYYFPNDAKTACVQKLPECECLKEISLNDYQCYCKANATNADLVACGVKDYEYFTGTGSCVDLCPAIKVRDANDITKCVCPATKPDDLDLNDFEYYDPNCETCRTCDTENTNRVYETSGEGNCVCKAKDEITFSNEEVYDTTSTNCKKDCTALGKIANADRTECIDPPPVCGCLEILVNNVCVCNENITTEQLNQCADLDKTNGYVFDATSPTCQSQCKGTSRPAASLKGCACDCLKVYNGNECVCDPTQENNDKCINSDEVYDETSPTCKTCKEPNREYDATGACVCKPASEIKFGAKEIYDPTEQNCKYTCKGNATADAAHAQCIGGCLEQYNYTTEELECIPNPSDEITKECLKNTNFVSDPSAIECKVECSSLTTANDVHKECRCDAAKVSVALNKDGNLNKIYDLDNAPVCMMACQGQTIPSDDRTECKPVDCLHITTDNITQHCDPNPSQTEINRCLSGDYISAPAEVGCKKACTGLTSPNATRKACPCDYNKTYSALQQPENMDSIFNLNNAPVCIAQCTGQTVPSDDRFTCEQVPCLYETTDNVTMHCIANPTDAQTKACLAGTNNVSNPNASTCREACNDRRSPNDVHKVCECDIDKMANKYSSNNMKFDATSSTCESACPQNQKRNPNNPSQCICKDASELTFAANEIYSPNALTCKYVCKDGAVANVAHNQCIGACLQEYNYETEKLQCIKNPSDEITKKCLAGTNYISDPSKLTCQVECSALTSPNNVHKACPCDQGKVATALNQSGNLNKIYDLDNAPTCMAPCTGQTTPAKDRLSCTPVPCLYETTDNVTMHCIANPTDAQTKACLAGTNNVSNPKASNCREACNDRRSPNDVHKVCECDIDKMANKYSSNNMKFDKYAANCESACPSSFTIRSSSNPAVCVCPATKPSAVTIQAGYYYNANSSVLTGSTACQMACPTTNAEVKAWISSHGASFTNNKVVYDSTKAGCLSSCGGNYVASSDKTACVCGINANNCAAGTYYNASKCACEVCPVGHYCPGKTDKPTVCPCGTYGATKGLKSSACSGTCKEGYYCPAGSTSATQVACGKGYACPAASCAPQACSFPSTSTSPYTACNVCRTESEIRNASPNYISTNEVYVNNLSKGCKQCKSNMVYNSQGACVCPTDKPYWNGQSCQTCQLWGTVYFARQEKNNPSCTLYNHLMGSQKGGCFTDAARVPSEGMKNAANLLSAADKNRNFGNGVYAYMVALSPDGKSASVVGVFTARSWYNIFPGDYSSVSTSKASQKAGSCQEMCGSNAECVNTCNYLYGKISTNSMFTSCKYAINNRFHGQTFNNASDELCQGGQIVMNNSCAYNVGGLMRRVTSPLVLDLKGDGLEYTSVGDGVVFDLDNDGQEELSAWTTVQTEFDNAFLVLDKNNNGQVDNGGELFGDQNGAENGFVELAKYDDNGDDLINKEDATYEKLLLWVDFNKNAKVDYDKNGNTVELKTLEEAGVTELSTLYKKEVDSQGNILKDIYGNITGFVGSFKMMIEDAAGKLVEVVRTMMDVFFVTIKGAVN